MAKLNSPTGIIDGEKPDFIFEEAAGLRPTIAESSVDDPVWKCRFSTPPPAFTKLNLAPYIGGLSTRETSRGGRNNEGRRSGKVLPHRRGPGANAGSAVWLSA